MATPQVEKQAKSQQAPQRAQGPVAGGPQQAGAAPAAAWKGYVQSLDPKGEALPPRVELLDALLESPGEVQAPAETTGPAGKKPANDPVGAGEMSGIATTVAMGRFNAVAHQVQKDWGTLTPDTRGARLGKAASDELKAVGVTETNTQVADIGSNAGQLQFTTWTLAMGVKAMSLPTVGEGCVANIAGTMYHEARHAEQWFRMARLLAGQGKSASDITRKMSIPAKVAAEAAQKPLKADSADGKEAAPWLESVYGGGASERNRVLTEMPKLRAPMAAAQAEHDRVSKDPRADAAAKAKAQKAWQDAYAAWKVYYDKYRALPEEADAWKVGGQVEQAYKAKK